MQIKDNLKQRSSSTTIAISKTCRSLLAACCDFSAHRAFQAQLTDALSSGDKLFGTRPRTLNTTT